MVLGSLWIPSIAREGFKKEIRKIREENRIGGEAKWQKVSRNRISFYRDLVDWFFSKDSEVRFRCIVIDNTKANLERYHENDCELAFYKFYYQLLHQWILDFNNYSIFCDFKSNRSRDRLPKLKSCLSHSNIFSHVPTVQAIRSRESVLMQLADILTGAASSRMNDSVAKTSGKSELIKYIETRLGRQIRHTAAREEKFNVFVINLQGGW